ncbi:MAG: HAD family hydrolase [Polyangiaceae bacterium]|nr:HAD family hydrolase [Polyangiaceae bacterium]
MTSPNLVDTLLAAARAARSAGRDPLVVLDLDGTLYDSRVRTLRVLLELAHQHATEHPTLLAAIRRLTTNAVQYRVSDTLASVGVSEPALVREAEAFWSDRVFTNDYVLHDLPTPGAVDFVRTLYEVGVVLCYLTGRDAPNMLVGTVRALQRDGFPVGTLGTRLVLKEAPQLGDLSFKTNIAERLAAAGTVIGAFDNEPGLCNLFREAYPAATVVHLATAFSPDAPPLAPGIASVPDFLALTANE